MIVPSLPTIEVDQTAYTLLMFIVLPISIACAIGALCYLIVKIANEHKLRQRRQYLEQLRLEASNSLGITFPATVEITKNSTYLSVGFFELGYPSWGISKSDGTRDLRHKHNSIIYNPTVICVGQWVLRCNTPLDGYRLVLNLRQAGNQISLCAEEIQKRDENTRRRRTQIQRLNLRDIYTKFQDAPTDFEAFCANLYRSLSWRAQTTPAVRDGGFDISLRRPDGLRYIAECKCYAQQNHVGRPVLQKLLGANAIEHADGMIVITTSSFTPDAKEFASQTGIELVDGAKLTRLCRQAWGDSQNLKSKQDFHDQENEIRLTDWDILSHYPKDMRVEL